MTLVQPTRILIVGGGGREHALAWKLAAEPGVNEVIAVPGSHAIRAVPRVSGSGANPLSGDAVLRVAREQAVELVVVGPEAPLAAGVADALIADRVPVFGPTAAAARIESSKAFCREVAEAAGIPMARGRAFGATDRDAAIAYATRLAGGGGVVVKADGLAAGKGVTVCGTAEEARAALAGLDGSVVIEERLAGREASVIAICDGRNAVALPVARDHKRLLDDDAGPNTGGMGAYSPVPDLPDHDAVTIVETFHIPVLRELAHRGMSFRGALYAGLMLTADGPRLLEFNARFGDPECQVLMPRLAIALGPLLLAAAQGRLGAGGSRETPVRAMPTIPGAAVGIVLASEGYPGEPRVGEIIGGLDDRGQIADAPDVLVFHGSSFHAAPRSFLANGGRVLTIVGQGRDLTAARNAAEFGANLVAWPGMHRRHDIALHLPVTEGVA